MNTHPNRQNDRPLIISQHPKNALTQFSIMVKDTNHALEQGKMFRKLPNEITISDIDGAIWEEMSVGPRSRHFRLWTIVRGEPIIMRILIGTDKPLIIEPAQGTFFPNAAQWVADIHINLDESIHQRVVDTARHDGFLPPELPENKKLYVSSNWQLGAISDGTITLIGLMDGVMMEWTLGLRPNQYGRYESFTLVPRPSKLGRIVRKICSWWNSTPRDSTIPIITTTTSD